MQRFSGLALLAVSLLVACGGDDTPDPYTAAHTWTEWVALMEAADAPRPYNIGPPDISRWRPEDFLPAEYLNQPYFNACEVPADQRLGIPRAEIHAVARAFGEHDSVSLEDKLILAERGSIETLAGMGWYCDAPVLGFAMEEEDRAEPPPGLTGPADALEWVRRGAASGDPDAMFQLGRCMSRMWDLLEDPILFDQSYYWMRRAAESLQADALGRIGIMNGFSQFGYETHERNLIDSYQWIFLWRLQAIFRRLPERYGEGYLDDGFGNLKRFEDKLDGRHMAAANAGVKAWLHAHKDVWDEIYLRPAHRRSVDGRRVISCPGEPGHGSAFNYVRLNQELARFGLEISPPMD